MSAAERWVKLWNSLKQTEAELPARVAIPPDHVEDPAGDPAPFQSGEHYFQVVLGEMFLRNGREWASTYDPMVFVVSEFAYDKGKQTVPFVVGPSLFEKYGRAVPEGLLLTRATVAGLHPYGGGPLGLTVFLYRVERRNYVKDILGLVESAAGVIDFATAFTSYTKIATVLFDGVETLLGRDETQPLLGSHQELGGAGRTFEPAYFALIDKAQVDPETLWMKDGRLLCGESLEVAQPYREADFVLYGVEQADARNDEKQLEFWTLWERVLEDATTPNAAAWDSAKANMASLQRSVILSPDLTEPQKEELSDEFVDRMRKVRARALKTSKLGARNGNAATRAQIRAHEILEIE